MEVDIAVQVTEVAGLLVKFALVARDGLEEISRGDHSRFVVEVAKLRAKVQAKADKLRA